MTDATAPDPRDADVVDPDEAPEDVKPSTTGTVVPDDDGAAPRTDEA